MLRFNFTIRLNLTFIVFKVFIIYYQFTITQNIREKHLNQATAYTMNTIKRLLFFNK